MSQMFDGMLNSDSAQFYYDMAWIKDDLGGCCILVLDI